HEVAMVLSELVAGLVVGEEDHAKRLSAKRDRYAQNGAGVERGVRGPLGRHALHDRLATLQHPAADFAADHQREALGRHVVGAESTLQDELAVVVSKRKTADLR